jgi:two-component system, response regulator FlrC
MLRHVLVVEDDCSLREALCETLELAGFASTGVADGSAALDALKSVPTDLVISDIQMRPMDGHTLLKKIKALRPELPVLLMTAYGTIQSAVEAMRDGASDYLVKPFDAEVLISKVSELLPSAIADASGCIAVDRKTREVLELARRVAQSDATVLITGESGSGKEVLFRYLHANSKRSAGPAVAINCAAIPENMLEAILFGYEKGAYTGAYKPSAGKFEMAQGGTLLLDEISEMSLALQAKLLRVLQEREVERLGGSQVIQLDVRVIATSNRDMRQEVKAGRFREDLYYRLTVFPLHMPPLRERLDDIVPIAEFLAGRAASASGNVAPILDNSAKLQLMDYDWPGNVRELDNVMQRAIIFQTGGTITARDIHFEHVGEGFNTEDFAELEQSDEPEGLGSDLKNHERRLILSALEEGNGSRTFAAKKLGISPRTLRYKLARMREMGMELPCA